MGNDNSIQSFTIKQLFESNDIYSIPIYQRNYAWEAKEIEQLIQDVVDYAESHADKNYYIGTLVVSKEADKWSTIDGQQRLTTLNILTSVLKNEFSDKVNLDWYEELRLKFDSREKSTKSLKACFDGDVKEASEINIGEAYKICKLKLSKLETEHKITINQFCNYLYSYVTILQVPLPQSLDLNHYFEIMNSRGEQLEKHEILKAQLMGYFNILNEEERDTELACFNLIWEACANMERYIQSGFDVPQRHLLFGDQNWNDITVFDFDELVNKLRPTLKNRIKSESLDIDAIIFGKQVDKNEINTNIEKVDRFTSVVNFQNFLLHVLRVQTSKSTVVLEDKKLLDIFKIEIDNETDKLLFAKTFIFNLFKCKFLFDKYIIKREFIAHTDRWALKAYKHYSHASNKNSHNYINTFGGDQDDATSDNRKILMLLAMFHVSIPSMSYKYWLYGTLNFLFNEVDITSKKYISYLEHLVKRFVYDNFLSFSPVDYHQLVKESLNPIVRNEKDIMWQNTTYTNWKNNLVFNYTDYLLWISGKYNDPKVANFEFKPRSSIEHYYPQASINKDLPKIAEIHLHSFGNLCLISHDKNSKLNNNTPKAKKDHYSSYDSLDSIKQYVMMLETDWTEKEIKKHDDDMFNLLKSNKDSTYEKSSCTTKALQWFKEYQTKNRSLLARVLLCFDDYTKETGVNKYNLFDWEYVRNHKAYNDYELFVLEENPKSIQEIISIKLKSKKLEDSYRYLFIKYPEVVEFCKLGNFIWYDNTEDNLIYLLESINNTKNVSVELYTYLIKMIFKKEFDLDFYINNEGLFINIGFQDNEYYISTYNDALVQLHVWNNNGIGLSHSLNSEVPNRRTRNYHGLKLLEEYKWIFIEDSYYRFSKSELFKFESNVRANLENSVNSLKSILKNGFKIKL